MSAPSVADLLAAALRHESIARDLGPLLASDLAAPNVFRRRIAEFLTDFLAAHDALPRKGDWQSWINGLRDQEREGVREVLRDLRGRDLSAWTPEYLAQGAGDALRRSAAQSAVARLNRLDDPAEALPELAAEVERIGRLEKGGRFQGVDLTPLDSVEPEEVRWLWPGRIPLGTFTLLDGDPGLGKSTLTLDLAARLSTGREMPDESAPDLEGPAGTVLLTAEDSLKYTIRPRFDAAEGDPSRIVSLTGVRYRGEEERFPHLQDVAAVEQAVDAVGARLIVVDPLTAYLPPGTDSFRDASVRQALKNLVALADRLGVAVLAIRHLRKSSASKAIYQGGGSIGLIAAARSGLLVAEDPEDEVGEQRVLASTKANLTRKPPALGFLLHEVGNAVTIVWEDELDYSPEELLQPPDPDERTAIEEAVEVIRQELAEGERPVQEMKDVARDLGLSWDVMKKAKNRLDVESRKEGFGADGEWLWSLPEGEGEAPKGADNGESSPLGGSTPRTSRDRGAEPKGDGDSLLGGKKDRRSPLENPPEIQGKLRVVGPKGDSGPGKGPLRRDDDPIRTLERLGRDPDLPDRLRLRVPRAFPGPSEEEARELIADIRTWLEEGD